jgi:adenosine kinase
MNDAILAEDKHVPMYEQLKKDFQVEYVAGGATQNSIRVAQWMLQQPDVTTFIGSAGPKTCAFGKTLKDVASKDGVKTLYYESTKQTGTCAVLVFENERSLAANLSAANEFQYSFMQTAEVKQAVEKAQIMYSAGFFLTLPEGPKSAMEMAQKAAKENKVYCLNLAAPFIAQFFHAQLVELMPYADILFGNESEALQFAQTAGFENPTDLKQVAHKIACMPKQNGRRGRVVVITQGQDPTIVFAEGKCTTYPVSLVKKALLVDTNGAGDAFVGGFLSRLALAEVGNQEWDLAECVRAGQYASRLVIQQSGCKMPASGDFV